MSSKTEPFYLFEKRSLPIYDVEDRSSEQTEETDEAEGAPAYPRRRRIQGEDGPPEDDGEGPPSDGESGEEGSPEE